MPGCCATQRLETATPSWSVASCQQAPEGPTRRPSRIFAGFLHETIGSQSQLRGSYEPPTYVVGAGGAAMTAAEIRDLAIKHGRTKKRYNAIVAFFSGAVPGLILNHYIPSDSKHWVIGLAIGLIWGNAFEYSYHR